MPNNIMKKLILICLFLNISCSKQQLAESKKEYFKNSLNIPIWLQGNWDILKTRKKIVYTINKEDIINIDPKYSSLKELFVSNDKLYSTSLQYNSFEISASIKGQFLEKHYFEKVNDSLVNYYREARLFRTLYRLKD
jgi:hypothetical protein